MIPTHIRRGVEVAILLSITFYAGFAAWHEEHTMRVMAEKSAFSRTTHLPRTLAYDNIAPILSFQSNRVLLQGYGISIINVGQDTIYLQVKEMNFYLYGVPIRLRQTPTTCRVRPLAGIKVGIGRCLNPARDAEQRAEGIERVEPPVEAERELIEVGL